jgi:hypothetical protein
MSGHPTAPGAGSRWHTAAAAAWVPWVLVSGAAIGWLSVQVQPYFAPFVVFPLLLGLLLAMALISGLRVLSLAHAPTVYAGLLLAIALLVGGQHYWSYRAARDARNGTKADLEKARRAFPNMADQLVAPPPEGMIDYLRAEAARGRDLFGYRVRGALLWSWWGVESVLAVIAAVFPIHWALKRPYCVRCRSWLRGIRSGKVSAAAASELAQRCGLPRPKTSSAAAYHLLSCRSGCGPSLFELSWELGCGTGNAWLNAEERRAVDAMLDRDEG